MESVEKLKKIINSKDFVNKVGELNAACLYKWFDDDVPTYINEQFEDLEVIIDYLMHTEREKTEIIAYFFNKAIKFYDGNEEHRNLFVAVYGYDKINYYDDLCAHISILREIIDEEGNILPYQFEATSKTILFFKLYCKISEENVKKIINLSNKKAKEALKQANQRKQGAFKLISYLEALVDSNKFYNTKEIEDIKKLMRKQGYSLEEIQNVENQIEKNNKLYRMSHPKDNAPKPIKSVDYKQIKNFAHELKRFIGDDDKPYDYLSDDQINLVINLIQELGYSEERKNTILNNIKKYNEKIMCDENRFQLEKTREDVFKEIDSRKDKPFTALSSEIYEVALKNETKIEELNNRIKAALNEIQNSVRELIEFSEERTFYIEYIMEALNDIDQCFAQAIEWNLLRKRKS